jgi:hypothetical protein
MSDLITLKINKTKNFSVLSLQIIEDDRLSWQSKGLHTYLISRPPNWKIRYRDLLNRSKNGKTSLTATLKELKSAGYLTIQQERMAGRFDKKIWNIFESPQTPEKSGISPCPDFPDTENQDTVDPEKNHSFQGVTDEKNRSNKNHISKNISSSSLPPPPETATKKLEEDFEEKKLTSSLPEPFDNLKDHEINEAMGICKRKELNLHEQVTALSILYKDKTINNPSNLLLKTLRTGGVMKAGEIIKADQEKRKATYERQKEIQEQKAETDKIEKEDRQYYEQAEMKLKALSDEEIKKIERLAAESLPITVRNIGVIVKNRMYEILMTSGP